MAEPKVRFRKDDGSSYPAWTAGKLGDITEKVDRKAPKGSTAPVMMVSQGNGFIYQADKYSRENAGQSLKNYTLLKQGEFAYNHGASKAKPYGVAYCLTEEPEARVPFVYHTFRITDGVNPYWHEALNTSKMDRQLKRMVSSGARMDGLLNINYDTYMDVDVNIPCIEEQQKIADFLSSVDEVITTSEQEVANLETQKKAVMKKIFSKEVRFKRDDGTDFPDWEDRNILEIAETYIGLVTTMTEHYVDSGVPLIRNSDIKENRFEFSSPIYLDSDFAERNSSRKHKEGDIVTVHTGDVGTSAVITGFLVGSIGFATIVTRIKNQAEILPLFVSWYFNSPVCKKIILDVITGDGRNNLNMKDFNKLQIPIPNTEEQSLIADFLSDFDEAISAAKKELELWKELKKGLLQQMFV